MISKAAMYPLVNILTYDAIHDCKGRDLGSTLFFEQRLSDLNEEYE